MIFRFPNTLLLVAAILASSELRSADLDAFRGHWPQFRGPTRDLISPDKGLLEKWPAEGPPLLWKADGLGRGYSSVSISDGLIFTQGHFGEDEKVIALREDDGREKWAVVVAPAKTVELPGSRSIPTVDGDFLFVQSVGGTLTCLEKRTGKIVWQRNFKKEFNGVRGGYGYSESPLVDGNLVLCTPGGSDATLAAFDKKSGKIVWKSGVPHFNHPDANTAGYASVIVADPGGVRQYIQFLKGGLVGIRASDGAYLWYEDSSANRNANISTPVYHDGYVFGASSYGAGGALVRLESKADKTSAQLVYHTMQMKSHHGGFLLWDGYLYGTDEAILTCLNFLTGEVMWEERSVGKGSVVFADGHIYLRSEGGPLALFEATPEGYRETGRFDQPHRSDTQAWSYPVVTGGRLYLRDQDILLCFDVREINATTHAGRVCRLETTDIVEDHSFGRVGIPNIFASRPEQLLTPSY
jgi:outer membrane protein assembly factor BamB